MLPKRLTKVSKDTNWLKVERWQSIIHGNSNQKRAE